MKTRQFKLIFALLIFLLLSLGFNAFLTTSSFKKNNLRNYFSLAETIGKRVKTKIETGLIIGKELNRYYGLNNLLKESIQRWNFFDNIYVCSSDYKILTSLQPVDKLSYNKIVFILQQKNSDEIYTTQTADSYIRALPIIKNNNIKGYLVLLLSRQIDDIVEQLIYNHVIIICALAYIAFIVLSVSLGYVMKRYSSQDMRKFFTIIITVVIIMTQIIYASIATYQYQTKLTSVINKKLDYIHDTLVEDFQILLKKGVVLNHVVGIEQYLKHILNVNEELGSIAIIDKQGDILFESKRTVAKKWLKIVDILNQERETPLFDRNDFCVAYLRATGNIEYISSQLFDAYLDSATVLILCFVFLGELNYIFVPLMLRQIGSEPRNDSQIQNMDVLKLLRIAAFIFFFAYDMPLSLITLYMEKFQITFNLISRDVWLSLPVTTEMFFATITTMVGGSLTDKYGWHRSFYSGLFLGCIGLIAVFLFNGPYFYLLSRSLAGAGFGLLLISLQSSVIQEVPENKATGIANIFAGIFAGSLCGNVTGAMLAERWSFHAVFLFAGVLLATGAFYLYFLFNTSKVFSLRNLTKPSSSPSSYTSDYGWKKLFTNIHAMGLIFFIAIPSAMTLVGVLYYLTPLYLKRLGVQQGSIGRIIMIYGLCIIYLGPFVSKFIDKYKNKFPFVVAVGILSILSVLPFVVFQGIIPVVLAVFIIGVASSASAACFVVYFLEVTAKYHISEQKRVSIFRSLQRLGQVVGSFAFASMISWFGFKLGLRYLSLFLFSAIFIFFSINIFLRQKTVKELSVKSRNE
jgi:MFS family permease